MPLELTRARRHWLKEATVLPQWLRLRMWRPGALEAKGDRAGQRPPASAFRVLLRGPRVELEADDDMVIGGSILPFKVKGQEGKLRAVATVVEKPGAGKVAIVRPPVAARGSRAGPAGTAG